MPIVNNPWVTYVTRSYLTIKQSIITRLQDPVAGIPEITDYNDTNPFIKKVTIWSGLVELMNYYIDNMAREAFLGSARLYKSAVKLARQYDYRIRGAIPATVQLKFYIDTATIADIVIPQGSEVQTTDGKKFITTAPATLLTGDTLILVSAKQWELFAPFVAATATGLASQKIPLAIDVADNSVTVLINGTDTYSSVETFGWSESTDMHFRASMNEDNLMEIELGDGITGKIPTAGHNIEVSYYKTLGAGGNVASSQITTINSAITVPPGVTLKVVNTDQASGGANPEALTSLKRLLPLSLRTQWRAVTRQDYIDVTMLAPGVMKAGVVFNCGKTVDLYIAPNGGGAASPLLLADTLAFMEERKMITTKLRMFSAGEVDVQYLITLYALPGYYNSALQIAGQNALLNYHNIVNQEIGGDVFIGDIYQLMEELDGVDHSVIHMMQPIPFARPLTTGTPTLNWTRQLTATSTNATYRIIMQTTTTFKLMKNNVFMGVFSTDVLITQADIEFTIIGSYTIGDRWEFKTYELGNQIVLDEPSLLTTDISLLTVNVIGGL